MRFLAVPLLAALALAACESEDCGGTSTGACANPTPFDAGPADLPPTDTGADVPRVDVVEDRPVPIDAQPTDTDRPPPDAGADAVAVADAADVPGVDALEDGGSGDAVAVGDAAPDVPADSGGTCRTADDCPTPPHAGRGCSALGMCIFLCVGGYGDCDGDAANGCETNARGTDPRNCGGCGVVCPAGQPMCSGGTCVTAP